LIYAHYFQFFFVEELNLTGSQTCDGVNDKHLNPHGPWIWQIQIRDTKLIQPPNEPAKEDLNPIKRMSTQPVLGVRPAANLFRVIFSP